MPARVPAGLEAAAPEAHVANIVSVAGTVAFRPRAPTPRRSMRSSRSRVRPRGSCADAACTCCTVLPGFIETEGFPQKTALQSTFFRGR